MYTFTVAKLKFHTRFTYIASSYAFGAPFSQA